MKSIEEEVRQAFEPVIREQIQKVQAMRTKFSQLHRIPESKVELKIRAEGRVNIITQFLK